jgi:broad specificity phosphatase PhoE
LTKSLIVALCVLLAATVAAQQTHGVDGPTLRIYLARHGQTDWNVEGRTQGASDIPLNATGREQAKQLKARLMATRLDAVYSSALGRSRETGEIVRGSVPLTILPALNERHYGKFEGRPSADPDTARELERRRWVADDALDGGESFAAYSARVQSAVETIRKRHPSGAVLIVGHGGTNAVMLQHLFGLTADEMRGIRQDNDEVYLIELGTGAPRLWKLISNGNLKDL